MLGTISLYIHTIILFSAPTLGLTLLAPNYYYYYYYYYYHYYYYYYYYYYYDDDDDDDDDVSVVVIVVVIVIVYYSYSMPIFSLLSSKYVAMTIIIIILNILWEPFVFSSIPSKCPGTSGTVPDLPLSISVPNKTVVGCCLSRKCMNSYIIELVANSLYV